MLYRDSWYSGAGEQFGMTHVISEKFKETIIMRELLTVAEVAQILRVDDTTVRRWVKQGALEAVVLPHVNKRQAYRIRRDTLNRVING